jgi:hypothetical protein
MNNVYQADARDVYFYILTLNFFPGAYFFLKKASQKPQLPPRPDRFVLAVSLSTTRKAIPVSQPARDNTVMLCRVIFQQSDGRTTISLPRRREGRRRRVRPESNKMRETAIQSRSTCRAASTEIPWPWHNRQRTDLTEERSKHSSPSSEGIKCAPLLCLIYVAYPMVIASCDQLV